MGYDTKTGRLTIYGKDVPTSKELGKSIVQGGKSLGKALGAVGSTFKEMAEESFAYNPKGKALIPGFTGEPKSMRRGGTVKKTGYVKVHKGEKVIPAEKAKKGKWIQTATKKMEKKGTVGAFGKATSKKIAAGKKAGGVQKKRAVFAENMKKIARKRG